LSFLEFEICLLVWKEAIDVSGITRNTADPEHKKPARGIGAGLNSSVGDIARQAKWEKVVA